MLIALGILLVAIAFGLPLFVRASDLPAPEPVSPTRHLDERKATIYENLRDLQAEYRMGKLSDEDYQASKQDLQRELAQTMAQIDAILEKGAAA
jgi:cytochrome c-type biogenesis protein CcmI